MPNQLQRFVRGLIKGAIEATHKPKLKKPASPPKTINRTKTRRPIPLWLRQDVFHRDHKTCVHCGAKAPQVKLEVDHIKPVSKGGTDDISNLQTLCFECNRGKSNRYST